jgi:hypothetical protein
VVPPDLNVHPVTELATNGSVVVGPTSPCWYFSGSYTSWCSVDANVTGVATSTVGVAVTQARGEGEGITNISTRCSYIAPRGVVVSLLAVDNLAVLDDKEEFRAFYAHKYPAR